MKRQTDAQFCIYHYIENTLVYTAYYYHIILTRGISMVRGTKVHPNEFPSFEIHVVDGTSKGRYFKLDLTLMKMFLNIEEMFFNSNFLSETLGTSLVVETRHSLFHR